MADVTAVGPTKELWLDERRSVRYALSGTGPPLLLLHTIHTQLEYFAQVIPTLADHFTVFAIDLPGHGHSSKVRTAVYDEPYLRQGVIDVITSFDLDDLTIAGESIGAVLGLTVASVLPGRVRRVVASNPYDYETRFADGARRGNAFANLILGTMAIPGLGAVFAAMENRGITERVLRGGLAVSTRFPSPLLDEISRAGTRPGYRYVERNVFQMWRSWGEARSLYAKIKVPVHLVYGSEDWSRPDERARTAAALGVGEPTVLQGVGHFSFLEQPQRLAEIIRDL